MGYTNWKAGEPNNALGTEDYVAIDWERSLNIPSPIGQWNDAPLAGTSGYSPNADGPYFGIIEVPNIATTSVVGGTYNLTLGDTLTLTGSDSYDTNAPIGDMITLYEWDLNGDLTADFNSTNAVLNLLPAQYLTFFATPGSALISLRVTDLAGQTSTGSALFNIFDAPVESAGSIPEPSSLLLLAMGGLVLRRRVRRLKQGEKSTAIESGRQMRKLC